MFDPAGIQSGEKEEEEGRGRGGRCQPKREGGGRRRAQNWPGPCTSHLDTSMLVVRGVCVCVCVCLAQAAGKLGRFI